MGDRKHYPTMENQLSIADRASKFLTPNSDAAKEEGFT